MKGFLATFSTREYINIDNIQKIDTYCYNNYNLTSILSFRKCKVNEDIVLDCGVDQFVGSIHNEDYYTFIKEDLIMAIDPQLLAYIDCAGYIEENFITIEYVDIIYVFNF